MHSLYSPRGSRLRPAPGSAVAALRQERRLVLQPQPGAAAARRDCPPVRNTAWRRGVISIRSGAWQKRPSSAPRTCAAGDLVHGIGLPGHRSSWMTVLPALRAPCRRMPPSPRSPWKAARPVRRRSADGLGVSGGGCVSSTTGQTETTPERLAEWTNDPVLGRVARFQPRAKPGSTPTAPAATGGALRNMLPDLAQAYGVPFIAHAYWSTPGTYGSEFPIEPTLLFRILTLAGYSYWWDRRGDLVRLHAAPGSRNGRAKCCSAYPPLGRDPRAQGRPPLERLRPDGHRADGRPAAGSRRPRSSGACRSRGLEDIGSAEVATAAPVMDRRCRSETPRAGRPLVLERSLAPAWAALGGAAGIESRGSSRTLEQRAPTGPSHGFTPELDADEAPGRRRAAGGGGVRRRRRGSRLRRSNSRRPSPAVPGAEAKARVPTGAMRVLVCAPAGPTRWCSLSSPTPGSAATARASPSCGPSLGDVPGSGGRL